METYPDIPQLNIIELPLAAKEQFINFKIINKLLIITSSIWKLNEVEKDVRIQTFSRAQISPRKRVFYGAKAHFHEKFDVWRIEEAATSDADRANEWWQELHTSFTDKEREEWEFLQR